MIILYYIRETLLLFIKNLGLSLYLVSVISFPILFSLLY